MGKFLSRLIPVTLTAIMLAAGAELAKQVFVKPDTYKVQSSTQTEKNIYKKKNPLSTEYYYKSLDKQDRLTYKIILDGLGNQQKTIEVKSTDAEKIEKVYQFVLYDHPELFWCTGAMSYTRYTGIISKTEINPKYSCDINKRKQRQKIINKTVKNCISGISAHESDYDKAKYVFEYLIDSIEYDDNAKDGQNICSAVINKKSVCAGYAKTAQLILERLGIESIYVTGTVEGRGAHAWNIIKCDGRWYHFDATFGDRVFSAGAERVKFDEMKTDYSYLCCTDEEIYRKRKADRLVNYPECTSIRDNYFVKTGRYFEEFDKKAIEQAMEESIQAGEKYFSCKFATKRLYMQCRDYVIQNLAYKQAQKRAFLSGNSSSSYAYCENQDMYEITIVW